MLHIREDAGIHPDFDFELVADRESFLFFDIETTGLNAGRGYIYLIGTVSFEDGSWVMDQYFAESFIDEEEVLRAFSDMIYQKEKNGTVYAVSYNGDGFDIPFIKKSLLQYGMANCFADTVSIDLLKKLRPYKKLIGLESLSLKNVCTYAGICREDKYSGRELTSVYETYVRMSKTRLPKNAAAIYDAEYTDQHKDNIVRPAESGALVQPDKEYGNNALLKLLLLHNAEDVMDLPMLMDILAYDFIYNGELQNIKAVLSEDMLIISAGLKAAPVKEINREWEGVEISIRNAAITTGEAAGKADAVLYRQSRNADVADVTNVANVADVADAVDAVDAANVANVANAANVANVMADCALNTIAYCAVNRNRCEGELTIKVPVFRGELKYFYADYKQYYYLPKEDMAIHKSVGIYTEKSSRKQATAKTCYQRKQGIYIPQPEAVFAPAFYKSYKTRPMYGNIKKYLNENNEITDIDITLGYIIALLEEIKNAR